MRATCGGGFGVIFCI